MSENCGDLSVAVNCATETNTANLSPSISGSQDGFINLDLPEGAQILNSSGEVLFTQDGEPDKCKIKIPGVQ